MYNSIYKVYPEIDHPGVVGLDAHYEMIVEKNGNMVDVSTITFTANHDDVKLKNNVLTVPYSVRSSTSPLIVTAYDNEGNSGSFTFDFVKFTKNPTFSDDFDKDFGFWEPDWYEGGTKRGKIENSNLVMSISEGESDTILATHKSFAQAYGCFSANMKCPPKGCLNSAFWLCTYGKFKANPDFPNIVENDISGGEIDVVELWSGSQKYAQTVHWFGWKEHHRESSQQIPIDFDWYNYHTYSVVWTRDAYYWYTDDRLIRVYDGEGVAPDSDPMVVLLSFANFAHDNNDWRLEMLGEYRAEDLPQELIIDWVKVYAII